MSSSEIIERVWNGSIEAKFTIEPSLLDPTYAERQDSDLTGYEFYTVINRNSYLHIVLPQILKFFKHMMKEPELASCNNWWFEYEEVPLKWNLPIGLLFDIHTGLNPEKIDIDTEIGAVQRPVWSILLKHKDYPSEYIIPIIETPSLSIPVESSRLAFLESYWVNQMKETCYVLNGSTKLIMSLSKEMSSKLWNSVKSNDFYTFESIFRKLIPTHLSLLKYLPVRIYLPTSNQIYQPIIEPVVTKRRQTIGDVLQATIPELFPSSLMCTVAQPLCHGIFLSMDTPVLDLYPIMKFLDGFLHISIVLIPPK